MSEEVLFKICPESSKIKFHWMGTDFREGEKLASVHFLQARNSFFSKLKIPIPSLYLTYCFLWNTVFWCVFLQTCFDRNWEKEETGCILSNWCAHSLSPWTLKMPLTCLHGGQREAHESVWKLAHSTKVKFACIAPHNFSSGPAHQLHVAPERLCISLIELKGT